MLVAWDARGVLRTRFKPRRRASFRATDTIRSEDAFFAELHPVVTLNGRAVLAWSAQFASEGGGSGPVFFQAAVRPSGADRFRRAELLERMPGDEGLGRPVDAVADPSGNVSVAWSGSDGADRRVRVARVGQDGRMQPAQDVSAAGADALLSDLAVSPGGTLIAVWDGGVEGATSTVSCRAGPLRRSRSGPLRPSRRPGSAPSPAWRASPASGPTVVFAGRAPGAGSVVQAATRSG